MQKESSKMEQREEEMPHLRGGDGPGDADPPLLALHSLQPPVGKHDLNDASVKERVSPTGLLRATKKWQGGRGGGHLRIASLSIRARRPRTRAPAGSVSIRRWSPAGARTPFPRAG